MITMRMKNFTLYILLFVTVFLCGCSAGEDLDSIFGGDFADARELQGVEAVIEGAPGAATRAGTVTTLEEYVGRSSFEAEEQIMFTKICRTTSPISNFTYPTSNEYDGIIFEAISSSSSSSTGVGWSRKKIDEAKEPDRVYWTDATSNHTFVAYSTPKKYDSSFDWKKYTLNAGGESSQVCYIGSLGDPMAKGAIEYTSNDDLEKEDLLLAYNTEMVAEPGGSVALVKFYHALSSVRVVVNISGFSPTDNSDDTKTKVSDLYMLNQPTMYIWMQANAGAQELRNFSGGTPQDIINEAYGDTGTPAYDQTKDLKLWIPDADGTGDKKSKTFTFYGITAPHDMSSTDELSLRFKVTYPNPLKPSTETVEKDYTATLTDVDFEPGYNTTINISLNHKNEEMTVGVLYENWKFIATPDAGNLSKNTTFLQGTDPTLVTTIGEDNCTIDDATWLYKDGETIYDIYGHDGSASAPYQISTANQLLAFAIEVNNKMNFNGKYVRLDADITMQASSDKTTAESGTATPISWIGIGNGTTSFDGTFIGDGRNINRLYGSPLFNSLGSNAIIEQLNLTAIGITGSGALAESNAGQINGCSILNDVSLSGATSGALVGTNSGIIHACYHIGGTESSAASASVGGLVGSNTGTISNCYHAGNVTGTTIGGITASSSGTLTNNYYDKTLLTAATNLGGVTGKKTSEMIKSTFVTDLNGSMTDWEYIYQQANYPTVQKK